MKKLFLLLFCTVPLYAQLGNVTLKTGTASPSGACSQNQQYLIIGGGAGSGNLYGCPNSSWVLIGTGSGLTNPMTTLGDTITGGSAGAATRLAGPTSVNGVLQLFGTTPSGGVAAAPSWSPLAVPTNAQTGTTYTVLATDRYKYLSFSNAGAIAVTLPQAGSTGFASNYNFVACAIGAGTATITPTTSTISSSNGSAYTAGASSLALTTGQCAWIYSDNTNYIAIVRSGGSGSLTNQALGQPTTGLSSTTVQTSPMSIALSALCGDKTGATCPNFSGDVGAAMGSAVTQCNGKSCNIIMDLVGTQYINTQPFAGVVGKVSIKNNGTALQLLVDNMSSVTMPTNVLFDGMGGTSTDLVPQNATLAMCNPLVDTCPGGGFKIQQSASFTTSVTGAVMTVTLASGAPFTTSTTALNTIGTTATPAVGRLLCIAGSGTTNNNGCWTLKAVTTQTAPQVFTLNVISGTTTSCAASCGTIYLDTPLLAIGDAGGNGAFHTQFGNLILDCHYMIGGGGFVNGEGEEGTGTFGVAQIYNCPTYGFRLEQSGAYGGNGTIGTTNAGPYTELSVNFNPIQCNLAGGCSCSNTSTGTCSAGGKVSVGQGITCGAGTNTYGVITPDPCANPNWVGVLVSGTNGNQGSGEIQRLTVSCQDKTATGVCIAGLTGSGASQGTGIGVYGQHISFGDTHTEFMPIAADICGDSAVNATFQEAYSTVLTSGVIFKGGFWGFKTGGIGLDIGTAGSTKCADILYLGVNVGAGSGTILQDNITSNTITGSSTEQVETYILGHGTNPLVFSSSPLIGIQTAKFSIAGGTVQTATQGTDTKLLTAGTVSGTAATLCTDANGGATTTGCTSSGFANPMTTLGDVIYGGASGTATRLAGPTATNSVPQLLTSTPSGGAATAPAWVPAGVLPNAQTGTTYTVAAVDRLSYVSFSNAGSIAVTLPQAGTTGFANNFGFVGCDIGAGTATITPTTSNISYTTGTAYTSAASTLALTTGQCAWVYSDNTNYFAIVRSGSAGVTSIATTSPITGGTITTTGTIACATCVTSAASLTSTAFMTGAGSQASQTPSATSTLDSSGNASFAGILKTGTAPTVTTPGTGFAVFGTEGTEPASIGASTSGFVTDSTAHCPIQWNNAANVGCSAAYGAVNAFTAANTFGSTVGVAGPIQSNAANTALTVTGGINATTTGAAGTLTAGGENVTGGSTASVAGGAATFQGGDNASSGATETAGAVTLRGGDTTNGSAAVQTTGAVTIRGGNNTATGASATLGAVSITGGTQSGAATNSAGANVTISGGLGTGNSTPAHVFLRTPGFSPTTGTAAQVQTTNYVVHRKLGSTTTGTATTMFNITMGSGQTAGALVNVHVEAQQGTTDTCSSFAGFYLAGENNNGTFGTTNITSVGATPATICTSGTLTFTMTATSANPIVVSITPSWTTIVPVSVTITIEVHNLSQQDISLL